MYAYEDLMAALEERGLLDRASEDLPTAEEIAERRRAGRGMERPELAVLLAYAKRALARELLALATSATTRGSSATCASYFPPASSSASAHLLAEHPLRRELIATVNANMVVNSLGPTFVSQLVAERGAEPADVVRAFRIAREVTGARARWDAIEQPPARRRPRGVDGADGRRRPARRGGHALVPRARPTARPRGADRRRREAPFERLVAVLPDIGSDEWRERRARGGRRAGRAAACPRTWRGRTR